MRAVYRLQRFGQRTANETNKRLAIDSFKSSIPLQTIALVHSHPSMDRYQTPHAMDVARALHLPMIVLTQPNIAIFDPQSGLTTLVVDNRNWVPRQIAEHCEKGLASALPD